MNEAAPSDATYMPRFADYAERYPNVRMRREEGILEVRLHTDDSSMVWDRTVHEYLPEALTAIGRDPGNRVVILTGTGAEFISLNSGATPVQRDLGDGVVA